MTKPSLVPDLAEYIVGFRYWTTCRTMPSFKPGTDVPPLESKFWLPYQLKSMSNQNIWPFKAPVQASCAASSPVVQHLQGQQAVVVHTAPGRHCHCGIYASRDHQRQFEYNDPGEGRLLVSGQVALWGKVIVHARGYRAQYAFPLEVNLAPVAGHGPFTEDDIRVVRLVRRLYGVTEWANNWDWE